MPRAIFADILGLWEKHRPDSFINILHYSAVAEMDAAEQRLVI